MPLQLPNLDDRRYTDLVTEARRLIPIHDPDWTNHNPSDPGITLLELFAYLTEALLYRLDRVTAENQRKFLKLLNGPDWTPSPDLTADIRATVLAVRARERAVTAADFERLATENFNQWLAAMQRAEQASEPLDDWWRVTQLNRADAANLPSRVPSVARASCVSSRNLDRGTEATRIEYATAHVSLVVLPQDSNLRQPPPAQKTALRGYLDEWRTLTTRHHVVGPHYAPIGAEIVIAATTGAKIEAVLNRILGYEDQGRHVHVMGQIERFLDRLTGGAAQEGWPFGRDIYVSELYERIEAVEGVDYVTDLMLFSECPPGDEQCAPARALWHPEGDLIGMALEQHHLPLAQIDDIVVVAAPSANFVPVQVAVALTAAGADPAMLKRQTKAVVRQFFHPRHITLKPLPSVSTASWQSDTGLRQSDLKTALATIPSVTAVTLTWQADAYRLYIENLQIVGLYVNSDEVINWQVQVVIRTT